ncbi:MAG: hypothetical protein JXA89_23960, partial [Anaerolineae bacterium]|nr:hypothetical protein [Anaerolineae bacterium]
MKTIIHPLIAAIAALVLGLGLVVTLPWVLDRPALAGGVIFVDATASGAATGLSWTDAYTNVQDALAAAVADDEIWIAAGVYYPDEGAGQT